MPAPNIPSHHSHIGHEALQPLSVNNNANIQQSNSMNGNTTTSSNSLSTGSDNLNNSNTMDPAKKAQERENLKTIILQWNATRYELFAISEPNEVSFSLNYLFLSQKALFFI